MAAVESGIPKVQQEPSEALRIVVENSGAENVPKDEPSVSSSERVVPTIGKLEQPRQDDVESSSAKVSICRIPHHLKDGDKQAYVPQIVSLSPYHRGEEHLRFMEQHKLRCLHRILKRSRHEIGLYLPSVKEVEQRARACYEGTISMSSDDFVQMMVLDGCFVIELFLGVDVGFEKLGYPDDDPVFSMWGSMLKTQFQRDMIMLENQIPLFILDRLLSLQLGDRDQEGRVAKLALQFFKPLIPMPVRFNFLHSRMLDLETLCNHGEVHCLEVFRRSILPLGPRRSKTKRWSQSLQQLTFCLTELRESGIEIRWSFTNSWGDIQFKDAILQIPSLEIHEGTRSLFLNLIAFEQYQFDCSNDVTSYVIFMHNLINSPEEVRYLRNRNIITHCLGSDAEVVDLFHRLCQGVAFRIIDSYLCDLCMDQGMYRLRQELPFRAALAQKWNSWRAILENKYFDNPWSRWKPISFIAASVLLVLTFIQALFAVYGYYRPRS